MVKLWSTEMCEVHQSQGLPGQVSIVHNGSPRNASGRGLLEIGDPAEGMVNQEGNDNQEKKDEEQQETRDADPRQVGEHRKGSIHDHLGQTDNWKSTEPLAYEVRWRFMAGFCLNFRSSRQNDYLSCHVKSEFSSKISFSMTSFMLFYLRFLPSFLIKPSCCFDIWLELNGGWESEKNKRFS